MTARFKALKLADWKGYPKRRAQSEKKGRLRGIGIATVIENTGAGAALKDDVEIVLEHDEENRWCLDCHLETDRDSLRLAELLRQLRDLGNTVLLVEHDLKMIAAADWLVDLGPGGGKNGGQVVAQELHQRSPATRWYPRRRRLTCCGRRGSPRLKCCMASAWRW